MNSRVNNTLAMILFGVAAYGMFQTQPPLIVKISIVITAYILALHWLAQYKPKMARSIAKFSTLLVVELFKAMMGAAKK